MALIDSLQPLTTQISTIIQIGKKDIRPTFRRGHYTISFIKQKNTITKENIPLLQILDAIRHIKVIPDTSIESSSTRLLAILKNLSEDNINIIVRLAMKYPPGTRALLGSLLEELKLFSFSDVIRKTLNPITTYKLPGLSKIISSAGKWNIK